LPVTLGLGTITLTPGRPRSAQVADVLWIALADQMTCTEVVGALPFGSRLAQLAGTRAPALRQGVDVDCLVHRDHVGLQAVDHAARLAAAATVALVQHQVFAGGFLPVRCEDGVVVLVELAADVVADIEQRVGCNARKRHQGERGGDGELSAIDHDEMVGTSSHKTND
jgi:hypothetical protein